MISRRNCRSGGTHATLHCQNHVFHCCPTQRMQMRHISARSPACALHAPKRGQGRAEREGMHNLSTPARLQAHLSAFAESRSDRRAKAAQRIGFYSRASMVARENPSLRLKKYSPCPPRQLGGGGGARRTCFPRVVRLFFKQMGARGVRSYRWTFCGQILDVSA